MERGILIALIVYFACCSTAQAQQYEFGNVQIKDIKQDGESEWQSSQVQARIITLSHQRFELELFDSPSTKTPTLSYEVRYQNTDSSVYKYNIILLNGVLLVNPGDGDFIETTTPLQEMALGQPGTIAINEDVLKGIVIYKME